MTASITSRTTELMFKDSPISESPLQKLKEQVSSEKLCDTVITDKIYKNLRDESIKNLELVNCTMTEKVAKSLATSTKEKVIFKKCILSDLEKDKMIDVGIWQVGDETFLYNPDLMQSLENPSRLSEELLKKLDASEEIIATEEMEHVKEAQQIVQEKLEQEIAYAKSLMAFAHKDILPKISNCLDKPNTDKIAHHDLQGLQQRIVTCRDAVERIIECYNKNSDHISLLLDLIIRENQIFTDVLWNGTVGGGRVKINRPHLIFDDYELGPDLCIVNALATIYHWGRDP